MVEHTHCVSEGLCISLHLKSSLGSILSLPSQHHHTHEQSFLPSRRTISNIRLGMTMSGTTSLSANEASQRKSPNGSSIVLPSSLSTNASSPLLSLPYELRQHIYEYVFLIDPSTTLSHKAHPPHIHQPRRLPSLSLVRTCRQIYHESRSLTLSANTFDFYNWYSSNVFECRQFLRNLASPSWQIPSIRSIRLSITEPDLRCSDTNPVSNVKAANEFKLHSIENDDILSSIIHSVGPYLTELSLEISTIFDIDFDWHKAARTWLPKFSTRMQNLKHVNITLGKLILVSERDVELFEIRIRNSIPWCNRVEIASLAVEEERKKRREGEKKREEERLENRVEGWVEVHQTLLCDPEKI